jgi:leucyl/phenylalanyl-tRNA--protein transferase
MDQAFDAVLCACAAPRANIADTWITPEMREAYNDLFERNVAHSVEVWVNGKLIGGLYGIAIGRLFFGESMFSRQADASKIAMAHLVEQLQQWDYHLIDCQVHSDHLVSLGACEIPRAEFIQILEQQLEPSNPHSWSGYACGNRRD